MSGFESHQAAVGPGPDHLRRGEGRAHSMRGRAPILELLRRRSLPATLTRLARLEQALASRTPRTVEDPARKLAAVAVVIVPDPDAVLLIRRAERDGDRWSGQMAFPGGRWSPEDADLVTTARRETLEEVGVDLTAARLIGRLDDSAPRTPILPPVIVTPFIFELDRRPALAPNHEVATAIWASLDQLTAPGIYRPFEFEARGTKMLLPGYHLEEGVVWGMTERILTPLLAMLGMASNPASGRGV